MLFKLSVGTGTHSWKLFLKPSSYETFYRLELHPTLLCNILQNQNTFTSLLFYVNFSGTESILTLICNFKRIRTHPYTALHTLQEHGTHPYSSLQNFVGAELTFTNFVKARPNLTIYWKFYRIRTHPYSSLQPL